MRSDEPIRGRIGHGKENIANGQIHFYKFTLNVLHLEYRRKNRYNEVSYSDNTLLSQLEIL